MKQELKEAVEWPLKYAKIFEHMKARPPKGILLYGPPGTGKTMLAKAVAGETSSNFTYIGGPEIMSKFYGESEGKLREIFKEADFSQEDFTCLQTILKQVSSIIENKTCSLKLPQMCKMSHYN